MGTPRIAPMLLAAVLAACSSSSGTRPDATDLAVDGPGDEPVDAPLELTETGDGDVPGDGGYGDDGYRECDQAAPCPADAECVLGLCLARCGDGGPACVEGELCHTDGDEAACSSACDDEHPCDQAYSCLDGECADDPCGHPEFWPLSLASEQADLPILVHYRHPAEEAAARQSLADVEHAWRFETETLGFEPPLLDEGACGPDGRFDVFVWRTYRGGTADVIAPNEATAWDDIFSYLILDPWGPYGGENLAATVAHELNHAMQGVHDWNETAIFFEMTSQYIEDQVYDDNDNWKSYLYDFQGTPQWAFDHDDEYETWYFYGSALYLFYLRDAYFEDDPTFVARIWRGSRNPPGDNEPDFEDVLDQMLSERAGLSFLDSLVEFSRWRWYTGARDDGRHFEEGATFPENAEVAIAARVRAQPQTLVREGPELTGVEYLEVYREPGDPASLQLTFEGDEAARWVVQAVPGLEPGSDGEVLDLGDGTATLSFGELDARTLIVLPLPASPEDADPEARTQARFGYTLSLR
jgi:hypothetical protein